MAKQIALQTENFPAESKWETDSTVVEHGDFSTASALKSFTVEQTMATKGQDEPRYNASAHFDLSGGNLPRSQQDPVRLRENITNLLEGAGIENFEFDGSVNGRDFSVRIKDAEPGVLTRLTGALSTSVDMGNGATAYALIDKDVATRMVDIEAQAIGQDIEAYTFDEFELTEGGSYISYETGITGAVVQAVQQDGQMAEHDGEDATVAKTNVLTSDGSRSEVARVLKAAGFEPELGEDKVSVDAPITDVTKALAAADMIPASANSEVQTRLASLRDQFVVAAGRTYHPPASKLAAEATLGG